MLQVREIGESWSNGGLYPGVAMEYRLDDIMSAGALVILLPFAVADYRRKAVPVRVAVFCGAAAVILGVVLVFNGWMKGTELIAALIPAVSFLCLHILCRDQVGAGDGMVLLPCGILLGALRTFAALTAALFLCGGFAAYLLIRKKGTKNSRIAFLPFLLLGTAAVLITQGCL